MFQQAIKLIYLSFSLSLALFLSLSIYPSISLNLYIISTQPNTLVPLSSVPPQTPLHGRLDLGKCPSLSTLTLPHCLYIAFTFFPSPSFFLSLSLPPPSFLFTLLSLFLPLSLLPPPFSLSLYLFPSPIPAPASPFQNPHNYHTRSGFLHRIV